MTQEQQAQNHSGSTVCPIHSSYNAIIDLLQTNTLSQQAVTSTQVVKIILFSSPRRKV